MKKAAALFLPLLIVGIVFAVLLRKDDAPASAAADPVRLDHANIASGLAENFSGENAHRHVADLVAFGPRPPASEGFARQLDYLEQSLQGFGWSATRQSFKAATPEGPVEFTNLIARHNSAPAAPESLPWLIGGHIDTKLLPFDFVGANDGGSSTGVLLEIARVLSTDPASAAKVEIAFFDGEEAFRPGITATDGLYGSKYFAQRLSRRPTWPAAGIILDIVGDPNFALLYNPEAPPSFAKAVEEIAAPRPFDAGFRLSSFPILDDHVPLQNTGLPCLHVIGEFGKMDYWHNPGDTLDKVTAPMLEKVGRLTLDFMAESPPAGD